MSLIVLFLANHFNFITNFILKDPHKKKNWLVDLVNSLEVKKDFVVPCVRTGPSFMLGIQTYIKKRIHKPVFQWIFTGLIHVGKKRNS